jgi:hypothetical protein
VALSAQYKPISAVSPPHVLRLVQGGVLPTCCHPRAFPMVLVGTSPSRPVAIGERWHVVRVAPMRRVPLGVGKILRHADEPGQTPAYRYGGPASVDSKPPVKSGHVGVVGASGRREFERRRSAREARTREAHPHIGGLLLALQEAPQHEIAWARGAEGEARVAASLAKRVQAGVVLTHDRAIPGTRANIDHIAVAPSGVWVIDTKRYVGEVATRRPLFGRPRLTIAGRDATQLVERLTGQVEVIRAVVDEVGGGVPIHGAFCRSSGTSPAAGCCASARAR